MRGQCRSGNKSYGGVSVGGKSFFLVINVVIDGRMVRGFSLPRSFDSYGTFSVLFTVFYGKNANLASRPAEYLTRSAQPATRLLRQPATVRHLYDSSHRFLSVWFDGAFHIARIGGDVSL